MPDAPIDIRTVNGLPIVECSISLPRVGAWVGDFSLQNPLVPPLMVPSGGDDPGTPIVAGMPCTVILDSQIFLGSCIAVDNQEIGLLKVRVIGGLLGGYSKPVKSGLNIGTGPTAFLAAQQVCAAGGEVFNPGLATTFAPNAAAVLFKGWQTFAPLTLAQVMVQMAQSVGVAWRVDYTTGTSYFALDLFAVPADPLIPTDASIVNAIEGVGLDYDCPQLDLIPQVGMVSPDGTPINEILIVQSESRLQLQLRAQQSGLFLPASGQIAACRLYTGTVLSPNPDGTVAVVPDDTAALGPALARCNIRSCSPSTTVKVLPGARVLIDFDNGDPSKLPAVVGFDGFTAGDFLVSMTFGNPAAASFVTRDDLLQALLTSLETWLNSHTHPTGVGPSGPPIAPWPGPTPTASLVLKAV